MNEVYIKYIEFLKVQANNEESQNQDALAVHFIQEGNVRLGISHTFEDKFH